MSRAYFEWNITFKLIKNYDFFPTIQTKNHVKVNIFTYYSYIRKLSFIITEDSWVVNFNILYESCDKLLTNNAPR